MEFNSICSKSFINYLKAAKNILNGNCVSNLEEIRDEYITEYLGMPNNATEMKNINSRLLSQSYAINAENEINKGNNPNDFYDIFNCKDARKTYVNHLKKTLDDFESINGVL